MMVGDHVMHFIIFTVFCLLSEFIVLLTACVYITNSFLFSRLCLKVASIFILESRVSLRTCVVTGEAHDYL